MALVLTTIRQPRHRHRHRPSRNAGSELKSLGRAVDRQTRLATMVRRLSAKGSTLWWIEPALDGNHVVYLGPKARPANHILGQPCRANTSNR